ncbi:MAG: Maltose/maltodextrin import ATP-binding protein MalK [bacterium]|nr:Maltose/maltodextrin import ATP-binding protein MalK [bacterium]
MSLLAAHFQIQHPGQPPIHADWDLPDGPAATLGLFGPSGCGKTSLLRVIAGLQRPQAGTLHFREACWCDIPRGIWKSPQERQVGMVFQDLGLFPHLTVRQNVAYGLRRLPADVRERRADDWLQRLQIGHLADKRPRQLSGGEQQRVALARALVSHPQLLLLDEPFTALDTPLRRALRQELRGLIAELQVPMFLVTHDVMEVEALTRWLVVMDQGRVLQWGRTEEVLRAPASDRVAWLLDRDTPAGVAPAVRDG